MLKKLRSFIDFIMYGEDSEIEEEGRANFFSHKKTNSYGAQTECSDCGLAWDTNDIYPPPCIKRDFIPEENILVYTDYSRPAELIYVACPYSDPDDNIRHARFKAVNALSAKLMNEGRFVFSPISHTHPIAEEGGLPLGWDFWETFDRLYLSKCDKLLVLCLDGWERSKGVTAEIAIAKELNLPIDYMNPENFEYIYPEN